MSHFIISVKIVNVIFFHVKKLYFFFLLGTTDAKKGKENKSRVSRSSLASDSKYESCLSLL